jgi:hypothetical protein
MIHAVKPAPHVRRREWAASALTLAAQPVAAPGPAIKRVANLPDGAPAFDVLDASGRLVSRIECIWNGWYDSDALATRLLASTPVMAAVLAKGGHIAIEDLGPAVFDCTVVRTGAPR